MTMIAKELLVFLMLGLTAAQVEICPLVLDCCEEDCCGGGTEYNGRECHIAPTSSGWTGSHSNEYMEGCVQRTCCESGCCGDGTIYDEVTKYCIPIYSNLEDTFPEEAESMNATVVVTSTGYTLSYENETIELIATSGYENSTVPNQCPYCTDCFCEECQESDRRDLRDFHSDVVLGGQGHRNLSRISCFSPICGPWICAEKLAGFLPPLPDCPCFQGPPGPGVRPPPGWTSLGRANQRFHRGANHCMRSATVGGRPQAGQQCCYDHRNALITGGRGAGTPDRYSPGNPAGAALHQCSDVVPFFGCSCSSYLKYRPPNRGVLCARNPVRPC